MEHYVTLFDSLFLPQGLALHASMERHAAPYTLWVLCIDDAAHEVLTSLRLPNLKLLALSQLETPELLAIKPGRSRGEYCWTLTPFGCAWRYGTKGEDVPFYNSVRQFRKKEGETWEPVVQAVKRALVGFTGIQV